MAEKRSPLESLALNFGHVCFETIEMPMNTRPRFSIVLPTRNRSHLLKWSLQSALQQNFDDYEVLVSNNGCTDATDRVVEACGDSRIRYVKTGKALSMHDHWDFAMEKARGDLVLYLCDDDALLPDALPILSRHFQEDPHLDCLVYNLSVYNHPNPPPRVEPNLLYLNMPDSTILEPDRSVLLKRITAGWDSSEVPKMLNCAISRRAIDSLRHRAGRLFPPNCPDYSFATLVILSDISWKILKETLFLCGKSSSSIGAMSHFKMNKALSGFLQDFGSEDPLEFAPLHIPLTCAYTSSSVFTAARALGKDLPLDRKELYLCLFNDLETKERRGGGRTERGQLLRALDAEPEDLRDEVWRELSRRSPHIWGKGRTLYWLRLLIHRSPRLSALARLLFQRRILNEPQPGSLSVVRGVQHGFSDIIGASNRYRDLQREFFSPKVSPTVQAIPEAVT